MRRKRLLPRICCYYGMMGRRYNNRKEPRTIVAAGLWCLTTCASSWPSHDEGHPLFLRTMANGWAIRCSFVYTLRLRLVRSGAGRRGRGLNTAVRGLPTAGRASRLGRPALPQ